MADTTASTTDNSALIAQILSMLQTSGKSGTPPTAPNQANNSQNQSFQLGANGMATPENPGSSPTASLFDSATATSLPTSGMSDEALQNWYASNQGKSVFGSDGNMVQIPSMSGGSSNQGNQYGMAAPSQGGTPEPGTIRAWMNAGQNGGPSGVLNGASLTNPQSDQFNQLLQQLQNSQSTPTPATTPIAPPAIAPVANNQTAYTDPSKAIIPGMGRTSMATLPQAPSASLPAQLQQGMTQKSIMAQGSPLQASTDTSTNLPKYNTVNQQVVNGQVEDQPSVGPQPNQGGGSGTASAMPPVATATPAAQAPSSIPPEHAHLGSDFQSYAPASTKAPQSGNGTTQDLGSADSAAPAGFGGSNYSQGGLDAMTGADAAPLTKGGANYASGGLDSGADTSIGSGGGMTPGMGSALASGIGQIGSAIAGAYAPIQLKNLPTLQQTQQAQPKPLVFTSPQMVG